MLYGVEVKFYSNNVCDFEIVTIINDVYYKNEDVIPTRMIKEIDHLRFNGFPDDIAVILFKDEVQPEQVWVRLKHIKDNTLYGILLNEPNADFGVYKGDLIQVLFTTIEDEVKAVYVCQNYGELI